MVDPDYPNQYQRTFGDAHAWREGHGRFHPETGEALGGRAGGRAGKNGEWCSAKKLAHWNGTERQFYAKYPKPEEHEPGYPPFTHFVW